MLLKVHTCKSLITYIPLNVGFNINIKYLMKKEAIKDNLCLVEFFLCFFNDEYNIQNIELKYECRNIINYFSLEVKRTLCNGTICKKNMFYFKNSNFT